MAENTVNGGGNGARSGAQTLVLLAAPLNALILRELAEGPKQQAELRRETGLPAQSTLRAQLKRLVRVGALENHRRNHSPGVLEYALTAAGRDLLFVLSTLEHWLDRASDPPLKPGSNAAKAAIKALAEGWSTMMLRALAAGPLSLTELDRVIASLSYPSLERRLAAMRLAGQVEARPGNGGGIPYGVTNWLRQGIAPLVAAARWERSYLPHSTTPIGSLDVEAAFLLAVPLLQLPEELSGVCRMAVEIPAGDGRDLTGVTTKILYGRVASCSTQLKVSADASALGSPVAWINAVLERDHDWLELGGDRRLANAILDGLHEGLHAFPYEKRPRP